SWHRVMLDSVFFTIALARGHEALHGGAILGPKGVVAIVATAGGGKSTLLSELLRVGYPLFTDDVLAVDATAGDLHRCWPGPPLMTVPPERRPPSAEPLLALDGEEWCAMPVASGPAPLAGIVFLARRPGGRLGLTSIEEPVLELLPHLLRFPRT